ncbi:unnamed protein product, partial [Ectocarpus sp. 8 AP-2014]
AVLSCVTIKGQPAPVDEIILSITAFFFRPPRVFAAHLSDHTSQQQTVKPIQARPEHHHYCSCLVPHACGVGGLSAPLLEERRKPRAKNAPPSQPPPTPSKTSKSLFTQSQHMHSRVARGCSPTTTTSPLPRDIYGTILARAPLWSASHRALLRGEISRLPPSSRTNRGGQAHPAHETNIRSRNTT